MNARKHGINKKKLIILSAIIILIIPFCYWQNNYIILPFIGGVYAPDQGLNPQYYEGQYAMGNTTMLVSRGLGNSVISLRLFNFPEIVYVEVNM